MKYVMICKSFTMCGMNDLEVRMRILNFLTVGRGSMADARTFEVGTTLA